LPAAVMAEWELAEPVPTRQWNNKLSYTVASCWSFLWDLYYDARIHERQAYS